jgi:hypothetical protein
MRVERHGCKMGRGEGWTGMTEDGRMGMRKRVEFNSGGGDEDCRRSLPRCEYDYIAERDGR